MPLPLPISPADALCRVIRPALELLPSKFGGEQAEVLLLAIALQETDLAARVQNGGTARGLWQCERISIREVLANRATRDYAKLVCGARGCPDSEYSIYLAIAGDDTLAAAIARLYLWTNPDALPVFGDADATWRYYAETWRPGHPHAIHWAGHYQQAMSAVDPAQEAACAPAQSHD